MAIAELRVQAPYDGLISINVGAVADKARARTMGGKVRGCNEGEPVGGSTALVGRYTAGNMGVLHALREHHTLGAATARAFLEDNAFIQVLRINNDVFATAKNSAASCQSRLPGWKMSGRKPPAIPALVGYAPSARAAEIERGGRQARKATRR